MPRLRQPPSLRKASIDNIVCHFEDVWCAGNATDCCVDSMKSEVFTSFQHLRNDMIQEIIDEDFMKSDVFTPFQYLRDDMIQEIIDALNTKKLLNPQHLQILLHSNLRHLTLERLCVECYLHTNCIIKTLITRCQKLTHLKLNLEVIGDATPAPMCTLMKNLTGIVSLKITGTRLDSHVIKAISDNCPNLLELDVSYCRLDDKSLLYLCNCSEPPEARPKLTKLSIDGNNVSKHTVAHLLKNQRSLQYLGTCELIDHALDLMYGEEFLSTVDVPQERIQNLLKITLRVSSCLGEVDRCLHLTFQCCPFLTNLTLYGFKEEGECLTNIGKLKHLKTLRVCTYESVDFSTRMAPLLRVIGENLTCLVLSGFHEASLIILGKYCFNLETLSLSDVAMIPEQEAIGDFTDSFPCFTNLAYLSLSKVGTKQLYPTDIDTNAICFLLKNATKLARLYSYDLTHMTDEVIADVNRKHGFRHLRECCFARCSSISVNSIWILLCPDNPLEKLDVSNCANISRPDYILVEQEAKRKQFNIKIKFSD